MKILLIKLEGFAKIFPFSTPAPVVSNLADMAYYIMSSFVRNVRTCITSFVTLKRVYNKKKSNLVMNMPLISLREARNEYIS